jgi:circadian clock protein KaiB
MSKSARFKFRLYVAGDAMNSTQAVSNLRAICQEHLPDRCDIDIVDVFAHPKRALADGIFMTPTLVKVAPSPSRKIVGALSQAQVVLQALGLEAVAA